MSILAPLKVTTPSSSSTLVVPGEDNDDLGGADGFEEGVMIVMSMNMVADLAEKKEMEEEEYIDVGGTESFFGGNPDPIGM